MKNGTMYAGRLKKAFAKVRQHEPDGAAVSELDDPLRRMAVGILGVDCGDEAAEAAVDRILSVMADWNEVRVSHPTQIQRLVGEAIPQGLTRCQQVASALQSVFDRENRLSLERLRGLGRRDARLYLEKLNGIGEHAVASVLLWSLGGHAVPVPTVMLDALRSAELVNPTATIDEVQAFLERNVPATEAKEFCVAMRSMPAGKRASGGEGKKPKKERPDRKADAGD